MVCCSSVYRDLRNEQILADNKAAIAVVRGVITVVVALVVVVFMVVVVEIVGAIL